MILAAAATALVLGAHAPALELKPCAVQSVRARCGTFSVPENRGLPRGRRIRLRVVVVPAQRRPVAADAFTFLAGGPGGAATQLTAGLVSMFRAVNEHHDLLLVDQRGTGGSNAFPVSSPDDLRSFRGDPARYGTRAAMDDLDDVRAALGYPKLDVYGISYGATAAQVYLKRHPGSVRTLTLVGATALDVPFYSRFAANAQHALDQLGRLCASDPSCTHAFPHWRRQFTELVRAWDRHPVENRPGERTTGAGLAGVVQGMLLDVNTAVSIPLVVGRAAKGDYRPLNRFLPATDSNGDGNGGAATQQLMYWSIWCNEPWVGLGARGPWHTVFDGYTSVAIADKRDVCADFPKRAEPRSLWSFPHGRTPVLAIAGGADPQDPISNLPRLKQSFPDSRSIVIPFYGHNFSSAGCLDEIVAQFIVRATTKRLDTGCVGMLVPPAFPLPP